MAHLRLIREGRNLFDSLDRLRPQIVISIERYVEMFRTYGIYSKTKLRATILRMQRLYQPPRCDVTIIANFKRDGSSATCRHQESEAAKWSMMREVI